jgi:predicted ribosome-associated RNA-binding protein Tma20
MSADDVRANPKGVAVDIVHFLNDGLWMNPKVV